ncbi:MAG: succinylglutamate desuccinylase/aspartoacylase family protein [Patescibacteria group bacterium]
MGLLVENFREFVLNDDINNPRLGEVDVGNGNVQAYMLALGVLHFKSGVSGKKRFDSAGIHGDEVDGQYALNDAVNGVISGEVDLPSGEWLVALGNILAIRENVRETGFNLNRLFGEHGREKAQGTYERKRADELDHIEDEFGPNAHSDWHGTIAPVHQPFIISSIAKRELDNPEYRDYRLKYAANFGIGNTIIRPYDQNNKYATFEWSAADKMIRNGRIPQAETIELGQIGTPLSAAMVAKISLGLKTVLSNDLIIPGPSGSVDHKTWRVDQQILKSSPDFRFALDRVADFMTLQEDQLIATDGKTQYRAKKGQVLIFPHESVKVGEQVFLLISQE